MGRLCIWSESAFAELDNLYGTYTTAGQKKQGKKPYVLPRPMMANSDLVRIINSDEVQSVLNAPKTSATLNTRKSNPLKRFSEMVKLNPYAAVVKRAEIIAQEKGGFKTKKRKLPAGGRKEVRKLQKTFFHSMVDEAEVVEEEEAAAEVAEVAEASGAPGAPAPAADLDDY